jgi:hypothetical protein
MLRYVIAPFEIESIRALSRTDARYELAFRGDDGDAQIVVAHVTEAGGVRTVNYEPHDPVFHPRLGNDPRPATAAVVAFDEARRTDRS